MADDKGFDINKIKNEELMNASDRLYFEKYGSAMEGQAEIIEEKMDDYIRYANETYDSVMENLYDNDDRYLVHGAHLKCSKMVTTEQEIDNNGEKIFSKPVLTEDMIELHVPEKREENDNGLPFANVSDTTGGLSGKLLTNGGTLNIGGFGNCSFLDEENLKKVDVIAKRVYKLLVNSRGYNGITEGEVKNRITEALKLNQGTCYCCMVLNSAWENLPAEYDYVDNTFSVEMKSYMKYDGREAINMMSMLFCRFGGGIIDAEDSGQTDNTSKTQAHIKEVLETLGWSVELEELRHIDSILSEFGITDLDSITCFLLICVSESGAAGLYADKKDKKDKKIIDEYGRAVTEFYPDGYDPGYPYEERGVGYMQVTWRESQLQCLRYLKEKGYYDGDIYEKAPGYVEDLRELPWETSAWRWAVCVQTSDGYSLNDYVMARVHDNGERLTMGVFLTAESFNNGKVKNGSGGPLGKIAREGMEWEYDKENNMIKTDEKTFPAPNNWDQFEANYEVLKGAGFVCDKE